VFAIVQAAGWPIWPLLLASIIAVALIIERLVALRRSKVAPGGLLQRAVGEYKRGGNNDKLVEEMEKHSPLGRVLAAGLRNVTSSREIMKESIEEAGAAVAHDLGRYLTTLGTIASISPLMGLFGTVVGMIEIFGSQSPTGANPMQLAHGIFVRSRFAENATVKAGHLVAANDQRVGVCAGNGTGLGFRQAQRSRFGRFSGQQAFVDGRVGGVEW
jgi:biopolymer transport protein ExbB